MIFFVCLAIFLGFLVYSQFYGSHSLEQEPKIFIVQKGENLAQIAQNLEKQGFIKMKLFFKFYVFLQEGERLLKAGEYSLSPSMSVSQIAEKLIKGETSENQITLVEGWNLKDIADYFESQGVCQKEMFFETVNRPEEFVKVFDFLQDKPKSSNLEGYLFPDTYRVRTTQNIQDIIEMMLNNFGKKFTPDLREEINQQGRTIFEIVTMASLLEKEVGTKEDKELVSGILLKRLKTGMPLQVDATIAYLTGKKTTQISVDELKIDSPYNTYKYAGLPSGPISNPGLESILAAIYPQESDFWYYLSTLDGETIFSKTLTEHNRAKIRYLK